MVLPGIQAILGFQLVAVFNTGFSRELSHGQQCAHLASVGLMVLSIGALLTPAAYHRIAETHTISDTFVNLASGLLTIGMLFLMCSLCIDLYLIALIITRAVLPAVVISALAASILTSLWFLFPLAARRRFGS